MPLIAQLTSDAASFSSHGEDGSVHFETPWHRAMLVLEDESGKVMRRLEAFAHGKVNVGNADDAAVAESESGSKTDAKPVEFEASTDVDPGYAFAPEEPSDVAWAPVDEPMKLNSPVPDHAISDEAPDLVNEPNRTTSVQEAPAAVQAEGQAEAEDLHGFAAFSHHVDGAK